MILMKCQLGVGTIGLTRLLLDRSCIAYMQVDNVLRSLSATRRTYMQAQHNRAWLGAGFQARTVQPEPKESIDVRPSPKSFCHMMKVERIWFPETCEFGDLGADWHVTHLFRLKER